MNAQQALDIINQATAQSPLTRQAHEQVLQALNTIKQLIDTQAAPAPQKRPKKK